MISFLPAFLVPSMYLCVCFLTKGGKNILKILREAVCSYKKCQTGPRLCFCSFILTLFEQLFVFLWKEFFFLKEYRYREMIFYIAIYKCVQRRKYINGFSQWGSMHELFFKDGRGWGTLVVNARFPNRIKPYRFMLNICAVCVWVFLVCLFVCFVLFL